ncbi:MAG: hypothetical protein ACR2K6_08295 [Solirubrobacterales bacterium]
MKARPKTASAGAILVAVIVALALAVAPSTAFAQSSSPSDAPDLLGEYAGPQTTSAAAAGQPTAPSPEAQVSGKRGKGLEFGYGDPLFVSQDPSTRRKALEEADATNAEVLRLQLKWSDIAPDSRGGGFDPRDPASSQYDWDVADAAITGAIEQGYRPILMIYGIPDWAEGANRPAEAMRGTWKPNPDDVADFGIAIARRYSGNFQSLPQVRDYMLFNEPNLPTQLTPQWKGKTGKKPASPAIYVKALNAFYDAVHGVSNSNRVITAGTAPYGFPAGFGFPEEKYTYSMRPLLFWRTALCVKGNGKAQRKCKTKPRFDVLAHHPINTAGGPGRSAIHPDDISTPDLHNLVDVLRAAEKKGNALPRGKHPVWATEIWWESNPPDNFKSPTFNNPSLKKQARWYTEAIYSLWKQGASMVLLYQIRDEPHYGAPGRFTGSSYETGVYFVDWKPKPSAQAVAFPFLGERKSKKKVKLWGKAPASGKVVVKNRGKKVAKFKVGAGEVFTKKVKLKGKAKLSATVGGTKSLSYKVK